MITLEQVKLLEAKVARAIEYVTRVSREKSQLQGKLDSYQKRIDELEVLIQKFKEDQGRIEDGILSALDRLNKFEDAIEKSITPPAPPPPPKAPKEAVKPKPEPPDPPIPPEPIPDEELAVEALEESVDLSPSVELDLFSDKSGSGEPPEEDLPPDISAGVSEDPVSPKSPAAGEFEIF